MDRCAWFVDVRAGLTAGDRWLARSVTPSVTPSVSPFGRATSLREGGMVLCRGLLRICSLSQLR
ncbi:MAG: hypothetical protein E7554_00840 [Ruminococcaceae bacterium]|nr:hypothetical protein [Oscillospiraceae bacterium]